MEAHEHSHPPAEEQECLDWCPICRAADLVRSSASPELREQWRTVQRDSLELMRMLIDSQLQRLGERDGPARRDVEDIPLD